MACCGSATGHDSLGARIRYEAPDGTVHHLQDLRHAAVVGRRIGQQPVALPPKAQEVGLRRGLGEFARPGEHERESADGLVAVVTVGQAEAGTAGRLLAAGRLAGAAGAFDDALRAMLVGAVAEMRTGVISRSEMWEDATVGQLVASVPIADGAAVFTADRDLGTDWHVVIRTADGKPFLYYLSESWQRLGSGDTFNLRGIGPNGVTR